MFWDASALVPLHLPEAQSDDARRIWTQCEQVLAWDWAKVEVDAALIRREADAAAWSAWRETESRLVFLLMSARRIQVCPNDIPPQYSGHSSPSAPMPSSAMACSNRASSLAHSRANQRR